jgi:hypothetical protein
VEAETGSYNSNHRVASVSAGVAAAGNQLAEIARAREEREVERQLYERARADREDSCRSSWSESLDKMGSSATRLGETYLAQQNAQGQMQMMMMLKVDERAQEVRAHELKLAEIKAQLAREDVVSERAHALVLAKQAAIAETERRASDQKFELEKLKLQLELAQLQAAARGGNSG